MKILEIILHIILSVPLGMVGGHLVILWDRHIRYRRVCKRAEARWEELSKEQQWDLIRMLHEKWEEQYD
jgi:hypothetical protein